VRVASRVRGKAMGVAVWTHLRRSASPDPPPLDRGWSGTRETRPARTGTLVCEYGPDPEESPRS